MRKAGILDSAEVTLNSYVKSKAAADFNKALNCSKGTGLLKVGMICPLYTPAPKLDVRKVIDAGYSAIGIQQAQATAGSL